MSKKRAAKPAKHVGPKATAKKTTKKAFDMRRDSVYTADPETELCICGAAGVVAQDEAGDLDTPPGPDVSVKDQNRLASALKPTFLASIDRNNVRLPIIISKIGDVATVIDGKSRVRAARASNRRRALDGRPPMKLRCVMQRDASPAAILLTMMDANNNRTDDDLADRIEKAKLFLSYGGSEEDAAVAQGVTVGTLRGWLHYDDHATDEVKQAVRDGLPASTAVEFAKIKDPDQQREKLAKLLATPGGVKQRSARAARALRRGANETPTATDRNSQALLLGKVKHMIAEDECDGDDEFWLGVREALRLVTGDKETDERLVKVLQAARS